MNANSSIAVADKDIPYSLFFKNKYALMALVANFFGIVCLQYLDPTLSEHMIDLGMSEDDVGFAFALFGFTWAVGAPIVGLVCQYVNGRTVVAVSFIMIGVSLLLTGPSKLLELPPSMGIVLAGLTLLGFSVASCFVPIIPEIVNVITKEQQEKDD